MQALPPRGHEALPEGRAVPDREVRDRAPLVPAGRARPRPHQAVRVPAPAAREAEGAPVLRPAREAVPHVLREGRARRAGVTGDNLLRMLESRIDNVVYRLGFAASRAQARQLVRHGHFQVNGRRVNIPSYQVRPNDIVSAEAGQPRRAGRSRRDRPDRFGRALAPGRSRRPHRHDPQVARAGRDRHAGSGVADRRALLEVADRLARLQRKGRTWPLAPA